MVIHHFAKLDSTNRLAVEMAVHGACHGTVIHADQQTGGRGRGGREFFSPAGGLYFSLIIRPELIPEDLPLLTLAAGVGLSSGIRQETGIEVQLKWPNDLYLHDRKLGGILTESGPFRSGTGPEFVVIGVGVNVRTESPLFPSSLRSKVISLYHAGGAKEDIDVLLRSLVRATLSSVQTLCVDRDGLLARWRDLDYLQNRLVEYVTPEGVISATGLGLAGAGQYVIRDYNSVEYRIVAGDINPIKLLS